MSFLDVLENGDNDCLVRCHYLAEQGHRCTFSRLNIVTTSCKRSSWDLERKKGHCWCSAEHVEEDRIEKKSW